ncbi:MAG: helicase-related protein, partial [Candidatus Omnitrophota bacterium]
MINTPPLDRQPVKTHVMEFDEHILAAAIRNEIARKGQIYFVHNRVETIDRVAARVAKMAPGARIAIGHGQMAERELERTMIAFMKGGIDILVCTTIIESGIDVPNANTLIVDRAESFGMADLYQLRGRVGRFDRKAYAYFVVGNISSLTHEEQRRLNALKKFTELGSGFKVAMQDLELRGAGN